MARTIIKTEQPVILEGYQAVLSPGKFGYKLSAVVGQDIVDQLEEDRVGSLKWAESKLKNPKRATLKVEPWEEKADGQYMVKFSWNDETKPPIVDSEGTLITDPNVPLFSGSKVKLAFFQKPYILKDGVTYGTSLKLKAVQIVSLSSAAGVDVGDMDDVDAAEIFGKTKGFKVSEPNIVNDAPEIDEDF